MTEELCVVALNSVYDWIFVGWRSVSHDGIVTMRDCRNVYSYNDQRGTHELAGDASVATKLSSPQLTRWTILQECWVCPADTTSWAKHFPTAKSKGK